MNRKQHTLSAALGFLGAFVLWTLAVRRLDLRPIGPWGFSVGFAGQNGRFHRLTGVHMGLYTVTDWLGLVPLVVALGFALRGFFQLIRRKSLWKADRSLLVLGGFYLMVMGAYLFLKGWRSTTGRCLLMGIWRRPTLRPRPCWRCACSPPPCCS